MISYLKIFLTTLLLSLTTSLAYAGDDVFEQTLKIATHGMKVQSERNRVAAQNLANSSTTDMGDGQPYRREVPVIKQYKDRKQKENLVKTDKIIKDQSDFVKKYEPYHPLADTEGYVLYPNVNPLFEAADSQEARHAYQANMGIMKSTKEMALETLELLK